MDMRTVSSTTEMTLALKPTTSPPSPYDPFILSDATQQAFILINCCIITGGICLFGSVANTVNIVVLIRQGFGDNITISLLALAVSDLGGLLTLLWMAVCYNPLFQELSLPFLPGEVQYLTAGWPHVCFTRISSWLTAFITLERYLCIVVPFKVKTVLTKERTVVAVVAIYAILTAAVVPVYFGSHLGQKAIQVQGKNSSVVGLLFSQDREKIEGIVFIVYNVFGSFVAFLAVIVCTTGLIVKLQQRARWRHISAPGVTLTVKAAADGVVLQTEKRVSKMVSVIAVIFIACFAPITVVLFFMANEPEFSIDGRYSNLFVVVSSLIFTLEAINSSVNIFIYYTMSTKYRESLQSMIPGKAKQRE